VLIHGAIGGARKAILRLNVELQRSMTIFMELGDMQRVTFN
jgi:hypothetical protein